jgi:hypothetical protein
MVHVSTQQLVVRSMATLVGLLGTVVALTWVVLMMRTTIALGGSCSWVPTDEPVPACPRGMAAISLSAAIGGIVALIVYVKAGLPVGPRLGLLVWPAFFGPQFGTALVQSLHPGGGVTNYDVLWLTPEAAVVALWPLFLIIFSRNALRGTFWSDGRAILADDDAPATRPADWRIKLWSAALQAATIAVAVWLGIDAYHAALTLPAEL